MADVPYIRWLEDLGSGDVASVGGKNASLGEMIPTLEADGVRVPGGFATTATAYRGFLDRNELAGPIGDQLARLDEDPEALVEVGPSIREKFMDGVWPEAIERQTRDAYQELCGRHGASDLGVAVRSSATAEDLPEASFAGQQETLLNIHGEDAVMDACRRCFASLFTDRAISYRREHGFDHMQVALSVGVQKMVRSDRAGSGVMFTIDTETGFPRVVVINAAWGLGETVVQGAVNPDEYRVFKPLVEPSNGGRDGTTPIIRRVCGDKHVKMIYGGDGDTPTRTVETTPEERRALVLDADEVLTLARWGTRIEQHYNRAMDIEWAKDGDSDELYIVQARPETVRSRPRAESLYRYRLKERAEPVCEGVAVGEAIGAGRAFILADADEADRFEDGGVLVTERTDPDWEPVMERAAAIVTERGGRTSHAAIVSRELSLPAIVGADGATRLIGHEQDVTVCCAEGERGRVYEGRLDYEEQQIDLSDIPRTQTRVMLNMASPAGALRWWRLPADGIGLARMEFIINNTIRTHPLALTRFDQVEDEEERRLIEELTDGYPDKPAYFVHVLSESIAALAASRYPDPVILRFSDFKSDEYARLIGGRTFEPDEPNPMIGFRGACRYYSDRYRDGFALECRAVQRVRDEMGLTNLVVMIPFVRTPVEADRALQEMSGHGLVRGERGLEVYLMAELPSNVVLAGEFAKRCDGLSIGTNDLTQLVLGVERGSADLADLYNERHASVQWMIRELIDKAHDAGVPVGLCGQAPSDHPGFADFLVEAGIDSVSVNPDSIIEVRRRIAERERVLDAERSRP